MITAALDPRMRALRALRAAHAVSQLTAHQVFQPATTTQQNRGMVHEHHVTRIDGSPGCRQRYALRCWCLVLPLCRLTQSRRVQLAMALARMCISADTTQYSALVGAAATSDGQLCTQCTRLPAFQRPCAVYVRLRRRSHGGPGSRGSVRAAGACSSVLAPQ